MEGVANKTAAAPSLIPEALPAVTVALLSVEKEGRSLDKASSVVLGFANSSLVIVMLSKR